MLESVGSEVTPAGGSEQITVPAGSGQAAISESVCIPQLGQRIEVHVALCCDGRPPIGQPRCQRSERGQAAGKLSEKSVRSTWEALQCSLVSKSAR